MLTISRRTMDSLEQGVFATYRSGLVAHIVDHFPLHAAYLGNDGVRRLVHRTCAQGETHGFASKRDLCLYTDLCIMLGIGFATDPQLPWAAAILRDSAYNHPRELMDALWEQAMAYLDYVLGPEDVMPEGPYRWDRWMRRIGTATPCLDAVDMIGRLREIWKEKAELVGEATLSGIFQDSRKLADDFGLADPSAPAELCLHAFLLGHRFYQDPLYPWIEPILAERGRESGKAALPRLIEAFDAPLNPEP